MRITCLAQGTTAAASIEPGTSWLRVRGLIYWATTTPLQCHNMACTSNRISWHCGCRYPKIIPAFNGTRFFWAHDHVINNKTYGITNVCNVYSDWPDWKLWILVLVRLYRVRPSELRREIIAQKSIRWQLLINPFSPCASNTVVSIALFSGHEGRKGLTRMIIVVGKWLEHCLR